MIISEGLDSNPSFHIDSRMPERVVIYIDGSNFYHSLRAHSTSQKVDFQKLAALLTGSRSLIRTYYYNAIVIKDDDMQRYKAQQRFLDVIRHLPYFDVRLGRLVRKGTTVIEKGIDVRNRN